MKLKYIQIVVYALVLFFFTEPGFSQSIPNGPGGVGSTDGSFPSLALWLDATQITGTLGSPVAVWPDRSGFNRHFTEGTTGSGALLANEAGRNVLQFNNANSHYYERAYQAELNSINFTLFFAGKMNTSTTVKTVISSYSSNAGASPWKGYEFFYTSSINVPGNIDEMRFRTGCGSSRPQADLNSSPVGVTTVFIGRNQAGGQKRTWIYNHFKFDAHLGPDANTTRNIRIGASSENAAADFFEGWMGEIILFTTNPTFLQTNIIGEYLDAKYNSTLNYPYDGPTGSQLRPQLYTMDNPGNGDYDFDVAGIGYNHTVAPDESHTDAQGTGIVRIRLNNVATISDDVTMNEYFFWGRDAGPMDDPNQADVPTGLIMRMNRTWRVSEVGRTTADAPVAAEVGNLDISFDLTGLGLVDASHLRLLIDKDNDGAFYEAIAANTDVISGAFVDGTNIYRFNNVDIDDAQRFTLGSVSFATPLTNQVLPITLKSFDIAYAEQNKVKIKWETASEINNHFFSVERSADGKTWTVLTKVDGNGTTTKSIKYETSDINPLNGRNYYRLKQTDFDGAHTYSATRHIFLEMANAKITVSPNPFSSHINIKLHGFNETERTNAVEVKLLNNSGKPVLTLYEMIENENLMISNDTLETLAPGLYFLQVTTSKRRVYYEKLMKIAGNAGRK